MADRAYRIGDFRLVVGNKTEKLSTKIATPTTIESGRTSKFVWENKKREFTVFKQLNLREHKDNKNYRVINDIFDFIDLIEILKAFNGNKLDTDKEYNINGCFTAETVSKRGKISLKIHFSNYTYSLFLDKFECSSLAAKFGKILQRCEAWQEQEA